MTHKLLLIGGGGHCKSIIESLHSYIYDEIAIIDQPLNVGKKILGVKIIGTDDELPKLKTLNYTDAFISIGSIGDSALRMKLMQQIEEIGYSIPNIVDSSSNISPNCKLGHGIYIGKNTVINAECVIGNGVIVNTGAIIEHECCIGAFTHIAPAAILCGNVRVGVNTHIGANATVLQGIKIDDNVIVGAGSVITKNVLSGKKVVGVPGRELI